MRFQLVYCITCFSVFLASSRVNWKIFCYIKFQEAKRSIALHFIRHPFPLPPILSFIPSFGFLPSSHFQFLLSLSSTFFPFPYSILFSFSVLFLPSIFTFSLAFPFFPSNGKQAFYKTASWLHTLFSPLALSTQLVITNFDSSLQSILFPGINTIHFTPPRAYPFYPGRPYQRCCIKS